MKFSIILLAALFVLAIHAAPSVNENEKTEIEEEAKQSEVHQEFEVLANELNSELRHFILDRLPQRVLQMDKLYQKCTEMQKNYVKPEDSKHPPNELTVLAQEVGDLLTDLMIEINLLESKQLKLHCDVKVQSETLLSNELGRLLEISQRLRNQASNAQIQVSNIQSDRIKWVRQLIKYPELGDQMLVEYDRAVLSSMRIGLANCRNEGITLHGALGSKVLELLTSESKDHNINKNQHQQRDAQQDTPPPFSYIN